MNQQIAETDSTLTSLRSAARTNAESVAAQGREIERLTNEITEYYDAVGVLTNRLNEARAGIEKQNADDEQRDFTGSWDLSSERSQLSGGRRVF